jgi:phosphoribosyl-ATP pyrophosphohydrolase
VLPGSPWTDIRLRKALNLAIDRDAVVGLMSGLAKPAKGQVDPSSPWFGKPTFELKYDLAAAKKLVEEASEMGFEAVFGRRRGVIEESADLIYLMVMLWRASGVKPAEVWREMEGRAKALGVAEKLPKK